MSDFFPPFFSDFFLPFLWFIVLSFSKCLAMSDFTSSLRSKNHIDINVGGLYMTFNIYILYNSHLYNI